MKFNRAATRLALFLMTIIMVFGLASCGRTPEASTVSGSSSTNPSGTGEESSETNPSKTEGTTSALGSSKGTTEKSASSTTTSSGQVWGKRPSSTNQNYPAVIDMKGATLTLGVKDEKSFGNGKLGDSDSGDKWIAWRKQFEKTFNCKLVNTTVSSYTLYDSIATKLLSGDKVADVITMQLFDVEAFRHAGLLQSLQSIPTLNLNHKNVNQNMVDNFTFSGKSYLYSYGNNIPEVFGLYFNRDMIKELNLTEPYELVRQKKWTWAEFSKMCEAAYKDLNGNNKIDSNDRFGAYIGNDVPRGSLRASGVQVISYNNGSFSYAFNTSKTLSYLSQIKTTVNKGSAIMSTADITHVKAQTKFVKKQLLFCVQDSKIKSVDDHVFWDIDFDFGFLPVPTFEAGTAYSNTCSDWLGGFCVPVNTAQNQYIGYLLNSIADMTQSMAAQEKADLIRYYGGGTGGKETYEIYKSFDSVVRPDLYCWQIQLKDLYTLTFDNMLYDKSVTAKAYIDQIDSSMKNAVEDYYSKDPDLIS
ncbi:MAG: extracellular solute-binding protein [Oscillospiraceae bacterium]|nr:extracellular solute-binding protein [Oscillospiraceae bacterium]